MTWKTQFTSNKALRAIMVCGASAAALTFGGGSAYAQDEEEANNPIIVTGSRLAQTGMDTPVPVTAVQAEELEAMDPSSLISSVSQLPQFYNNSTPNNSNFFTRGGTGNLNLRGLGANRTLTLLNGRRFPSSSAFGGVDINLFPEAMIKGIETVTGGASAQYGTDAVAGVVNFLLDTKYDGLEIDGQAGITSRGDGENYDAKFGFGTDIGDRGHLLIAGSWAKQDGIHDLYSRDWYTSTGAVNLGTAAAPYFQDFPNVHSISGSRDGIISSSNPAINGLAFDANGNYAPFVVGSPSFGQVGANGVTSGYASGGGGDDLADGRFTLYPDTERYSIFAYGDYDFSDNFTVFAQYVRGYNDQFQYNGQPSLFGQPTAITIYEDNYYLPASLKALVDTGPGVQSFTLRRAGISTSEAAANQFKDSTTQNVGTIGFDAEFHTGGFLDGWNVNGFYQYGHSRRVWQQYSLRIDRIFAAVDAVDDGSGNAVCRVSLDPEGAAAFPGCQPLDLFGRDAASDAAIDYVMGNDVGQHVDTALYFANLGYTGERLAYDASAFKRNITTFEQHLAEVSAHGNVFDLPGGPVSMALGASYREESIHQVVEDTSNQESNFDGAYHPCSTATAAIYGLRGLNPADCNNTVGFQFSKVSNIQGRSTVKEAFVETLIPIFDTGKGANASLNLAGRWADYSGAGTIWAYKAGLDISVSDSLRFRGTYSRDVRAGNLSERFDKTGGSANVLDARTTAQNPTWGGQTYNVTIFSGGNPNIKPEEADTFTAGVVFQPEFIPGLSASFDWYKVKINGAISTVGNNEVVRRCFEENDPQFCALVVTDPAQNDKLILVGNQYVNVAESNAQGVDAEISYRTDLKLFGGDESLSSRVFMSWLIDRSDVGATGAVTEYDGLTGINPSTGPAATPAGSSPRFKATGNLTYRNGPFTLFLQERVIGAGYRAYTLGSLPVVEGGNVADNSVPAVFYTDIRLSYEFAIGDSSLELFGSVTNLFDRDPPTTGYYSTFSGYVTQYNAALFDVLGQRFTIGAKFKM